ncbi:hypothetical protein P4B35_23765, partial [Pontiellaceae bacterium B12227]|nr:hypothetical protein [Pontiellaceae bacterium B12227]
INLYYIANNLKESGPDLEDEIPLDEKWLNQKSKYFRNSQCIGLAVSKRPEGPFVRHKIPVVAPDNIRFKNIAVNPAVIHRDGRFVMIMKGDDINREGVFRVQFVGYSDQAEGPFAFEDTPVYDEGQTEDACMWYDSNVEKYFMVCHVMGNRNLAMFSSRDSVTWERAAQPVLMEKQFLMEDGSIWMPKRVERPFVLTDETGRPLMLYLAVWDNEHKLNGNIAVKLDVEYVSVK